MLSFAGILPVWRLIGTADRSLERCQGARRTRLADPTRCQYVDCRGGAAVVHAARGGVPPMPTKSSEVLVGRRYLERGFVDAAMRLFVRNAPAVEPDDWSRLAERLTERNRIPDVVRICEIGAVPLPRERMLAIADEHLRRKDVDTAIRLFELADADRPRWAALVDVLTSLPDRERLAIEVTDRHLPSAGGDDSTLKQAS